MHSIFDSQETPSMYQNALRRSQYRRNISASFAAFETSTQRPRHYQHVINDPVATRLWLALYIILSSLHPSVQCIFVQISTKSAVPKFGPDLILLLTTLLSVLTAVLCKAPAHHIVRIGVC
ncbi:hypothetical protein F5146DRAFT_1069913, partial [Armillaria mellea]